MSKGTRNYNATRGYNLVYQEGATLEEVAAEYGMSIDTFSKIAQRAHGSRNFDALREQSNQNKKARKKQERKTNAKKVKEQDKPCENKEENRVKELEEQLENVQVRIDELMRIMRESMMIRRSLEVEVSKAQEAFNTAETNLNIAKSNLENAMEKKKKNEENFIVLSSTKKSIMHEIEELKSKHVYLIAPNYKGELPRSGKLVSTVEFSDSRVLKEFGDEVMEEPTMSHIMESGFNKIQDFSVAFEFAKLALKYYLCEETGNVTILVDDQRFKNVLLQQNVPI